jgi:hypothetical protein
MGFPYWRIVEDVPGRRLRLQRSDDARREQLWDADARLFRLTRLRPLGRTIDRVIPFDRFEHLRFTIFPEKQGPYLVIFDLAARSEEPLRGPVLYKDVETRPAALELFFKSARIARWPAYRVSPAHADGVTVEVGPRVVASGSTHPYRAAADPLELGTRAVPPLAAVDHPYRTGPSPGARFRDPPEHVAIVEEGWRIGRWRLVRWRPESALLVRHEGGIWRWLGRFRRQYSRHADFVAHFDFLRGIFLFRSGRKRTPIPLEDVVSLTLKPSGSWKKERWSVVVERPIGSVTVAETAHGEGPDTVGYERALALMVGLARALDAPWSVSAAS